MEKTQMDDDDRNEGFAALVRTFNGMAPDHRLAFVEVMTWLIAQPRQQPPVSKSQLFEMIDAVRASNALQSHGHLN
jgi:hypothetical protein